DRSPAPRRRGTGPAALQEGSGNDSGPAPRGGSRAAGVRDRGRSAVGHEAGRVAPDGALDDALLRAGGVDDLSVAGVDRDVAGPGDDVAGLGLGLGDPAPAVGDLAGGAGDVDARGLVGV